MYADSPFSRLSKESLRRLYANHPIRDEIVGTPASIRRITPSHLYRVYRAFYRVSNMHLFISGDLTPDDVLTALTDVSVRSCEGDFRIPPAYEPGRTFSSVRTIRQEVSKPLFSVTCGLPEPTGDVRERHRVFFSLCAVVSYLFSSSGTLYEKLKRDGLVSAPLRHGMEWDPGVCFMTVSGKSDRPSRVFRMIRESLCETLEKGIPEDDFLRLSRATYAGHVSSFDDEESLVDEFCELIPLGIDPFEAGEIINSVDVRYANETARRYLSADRLNLTVVRSPIEKANKEDEI